MEKMNAHLLELPVGVEATGWAGKIEYMFNNQLETWAMAQKHYQQFETVQRRTIKFDDFIIELQFNPARERSTCADVSKTAIENRSCFLCPANLPVEQKGLSILDKYLILVNPFPIFSRHLTITDYNHVPQNITERLTDLLSISRDLEGYSVFYNGPRCGASAPDHFHFQAAKSDEMPLNKEFESLKISNGKLLVQEDDIQVTFIENCLRPAIAFESEYREPIDYFFDKLVMQLPFDKESGEPMINLISTFTDGIYRLIVFPRIAQRPSCFFKEGTDRIVVSVASVELSGIIVTPREEDFVKITKEDLVKIFGEVTLDPKFISNLNFEIQDRK